jgi:hypothetical protein
VSVIAVVARASDFWRSFELIGFIKTIVYGRAAGRSTAAVV